MKKLAGVFVLAGCLAVLPGSSVGQSNQQALGAANAELANVLPATLSGVQQVKSRDPGQSKTSPGPLPTPAPTELPQKAAGPAQTPESKPKSTTDKNNETKSEPSAFQPCNSGNWIKNDRGEITVGCPKVWRSDRIFTVLDGLLRDVDSITVNALQDLDPNDPNMAEIVSIVNDLQVSAKFDQAALVNNRLQLQQIQNAQQNNDVLIKRRQDLVKQQLDVRQKELDMISAGKATDDNKDYTNLKASDTAIANQISDIDSQLKANAGQSVSSTAATSVDQPKTGTALSALPDDLKKTVQGLLRQPTLPASMRMDNVIELLHERLAREFAVMYDDLSRLSDKYDLYLVQFDIGVVPYHGAKDRQAMVQLTFGDSKVEEGTVLAYDLYPAASSYNILRGQDKTTRVGISGAAQTLFGLGIAASFNHERDELHSGLSQSLFVSGFGAGSHRFGWLIGPAPYDNFVNPGNRIVNAVVLVPKNADGSQRQSVNFKVTGCWPSREKRYALFTSHSKECSSSDEHGSAVVINMALPLNNGLVVEHVAYTPQEAKETPGSAASDAQAKKADTPATTPVGQGQNQQLTDDKITNTVLIRFKGTIDPNLTITAGNKILNRVRDVRGRAIYGGKSESVNGNDKEKAAISASRFGLLEKDSIDPDTWLQLDSHTVVLNISKATAGTDVFPVITLGQPGGSTQPGESAGELSAMMTDANTSARIGEWLFKRADLSGTDKRFPDSAFQPLFTMTYGPGPIRVYVDSVDQQNPPRWPIRLRINSETHLQGRSSPVWLHDHAQVVLQPENTPDDTKGWALNCFGEQGTLSCSVPAAEIAAKYGNFPDRFKIWVDEPPYFGRPGLWADYDVIKDQNTQWAAQAYPAGDWKEVREVYSMSGAADHWEATIQLRNLPAGTNAVRELRDHGKQQLQTLLATMPVSLVGNKNIATADAQLSNGQRTSWRSAVDTLSKQASPINYSFGRDSLSVRIPFTALPLMAQRLHVENTPPPTAAVPAPTPQELFALPDLLSKLLPGTVTVNDLGNGGYRMEGDHLQAVELVRLESGDTAIVRPASVSLNNLYFNVNFAGTGLQPNASYNVFFVIGNMTIPAMQIGPNDNKLHQVVVPSPAKK